jgi:transcriptional regulator of acetoin/glycerol metabolism
LTRSDRLSDSGQAALLGWLTAMRSIRVIATSSQPLIPLVDAGGFLQALYYHLNHVLITIPGARRLESTAGRSSAAS